MKKEKHYNKIEERILRVLYQQKIDLTIYEVAKECSISYPTAKKYLANLYKRGLIGKQKKMPKSVIEPMRLPDSFGFNFSVFDDEKPKKRKR